MCVVCVFCPFSFAPHFALHGQFRHCSVCFGRSACHPGLSWYAAGPRPAGRYRCHLPDRRYIPKACICPAARCILYTEAPELFRPLSFSSRSTGSYSPRVIVTNFYFVEFPCDFIIYGIPCHTVVDVSCRYLHTENKPAFVADCVPHTQTAVHALLLRTFRSPGLLWRPSFCCLSAAGILRIVVVIVFLLDRLLPQLFALCIDPPGEAHRSRSSLPF